MCLQNFIRDSQTQTSAALQLRLERFKNFLELLWCEATASVGKTDLPVVAERRNSHGQSPSLGHRVQGAVRKDAKHLLDPVAVCKGECRFDFEVPHDLYRRCAVGAREGAKGVLKHWKQVDDRHFISLL